MFSIIIPSLNNLKYLENCIKSIKKNSSFNHEIIVHVNIGSDGTVDYLKRENIKYSFTEYNAGICEGVNTASRMSSTNYILYAHDDFYFCPEWDLCLLNEVEKMGNKKFYSLISRIILILPKIGLMFCKLRPKNWAQKILFIRNYDPKRPGYSRLWFKS